MSETSNYPGGSDPTQRFDPGAPTPAASDPTAPHSDADLTQRMTSPPAAYPGLPANYTAPEATQPAYGQPPQYGQPTYGQPGYQNPAYAGGYPQQYDPYGRPLSDKSKVVAGVLSITLGGFGAGRFYTGHTGIAIGQLVVTLVTCGLGSFWGLIDGIIILVNGGTDAEGRVLRD